MDIMELGAIGELVGGLAVIGSLLYLGWQVRQSNAIERTETLRAFARDWSTAVVKPMLDAGNADLLRRGNANFDRLNETEKFQLFGYYGQVFFFGQELFFLNEGSRVEPQLVAQIDGVILSFLTMPGVARWYEVSQSFVAPAYATYLDSLRNGPTTPVLLSEAYPAFIAAEDL